MSTIDLIGTSLIVSTIVSLLISMRASHNKILGFIALCAGSFPFVIGNVFGQEFVRTSQAVQLIMVLLFAIHIGCLFTWFYLNRLLNKPAVNKIVIVPNSDRPYRFNPIENRSAEEILLWFQQIVDVELNLQNYALARDAIRLHLINNSAPSVKSVLDDFEGVEPLMPFVIELKRNLLPS